LSIKIHQISKQIYKEDIFAVLENNYKTVGPQWTAFQMEWCNSLYATFKDHDKFLIIIYLIKKTLDFYSRNFIKLSFDGFYSQNIVEIEKINIIDISIALNIPKESTRRKVLELEKVGAISRLSKKKIIIDRSKFHFTKPVESIKKMSRFLSLLSEKSKNAKILQRKISSEDLAVVIKDNFTYIWKIYYELQIPMLINYKEIFTDIESFHIFGTCVVNQHLLSQKKDVNNINRADFIKSIYSDKKMRGLNAMSISDITGIPRATVVRKLKSLVKKNFLEINNKKHYKLTGKSVKQLVPLQNIVLNQLANFSTKIFNLAIL